MSLVTYKGPTSRADISSEFHVEDADGKMHVLLEGYVAEVPDELAAELIEGKDRIKGHKFEAAPDGSAAGYEPGKAPAEATAVAADTSGDESAGGSGGSGSSKSATGRSAART